MWSLISARLRRDGVTARRHEPHRPSKRLPASRPNPVLVLSAQCCHNGQSMPMNEWPQWRQPRLYHSVGVGIRMRACVHRFASRMYHTYVK